MNHLLAAAAARLGERKRSEANFDANKGLAHSLGRCRSHCVGTSCPCRERSREATRSNIVSDEQSDCSSDTMFDLVT